MMGPRLILVSVNGYSGAEVVAAVGDRGGDGKLVGPHTLSAVESGEGVVVWCPGEHEHTRLVPWRGAA